MNPRSFLYPVAAALVVALSIPAAAVADEYIDQVNGMYGPIRASKRSDLVLLPVVAKMDPPPASVNTPEKAMMVAAGMSGWSAAESWASAEPQRAVLAALKEVVKEEDPVEAMAFGQPYGADAVATSAEGVSLIRAKLYTDLGDPPMLAGARFLYLEALNNVASLAHVEATRLAAEGKPDAAIGVVIDLLFFARQIADRQFFDEVRWGNRVMVRSLDRVRDIAYVDFRYGKKELTPPQIAAVLDRLRTEGGYLRLDRLLFPTANKAAAQQVVAHTFTPRSGPNATFGQTMARLAATQRPLRLFAEAARWDQVAAVHGNWFDTSERLNRVYDDMAARWPLPPFDRRNELLSDYEKLNTTRFAVLAATIPDMSVLFNDRQVIQTQLIGTRGALGIVAFYYGAKNFPPDIASIRPRFVKVIEADPFNRDRARGKEPPLEYFVPIRDQHFDPRETPQPHRINVNTSTDNFQVQVGDDQFVLYSVGPDGAKAWAVDVSGEPVKNAIGDLLIWPPVTSLVRQRLTETGALK